MRNDEIAAEIAYTTYCEAVGGKAFNGDPLPSWEEFSNDTAKQKQARAWIEAAAAVLLRFGVSNLD